MTLDGSTKTGARALERLETEVIGWLTTTNPDGQPQSSPIWFLWTNEDVLIYSGAKFLCPCAGTITLMPGTASDPAFRRIDVDVNTGKVRGLHDVG